MAGLFLAMSSLCEHIKSPFDDTNAARTLPFEIVWLTALNCWIGLVNYMMHEIFITVPQSTPI